MFHIDLYSPPVLSDHNLQVTFFFKKSLSTHFSAVLRNKALVQQNFELLYRQTYQKIVLNFRTIVFIVLQKSICSYKMTFLDLIKKFMGKYVCVVIDIFIYSLPGTQEVWVRAPPGATLFLALLFASKRIIYLSSFITM